MNIHHKIMNIIGKLDNGSHSSCQLQGCDEEIFSLFKESLAEKDNEITKLKALTSDSTNWTCPDCGNIRNGRPCLGCEAKKWRDMCEKLAETLVEAKKYIDDDITRQEILEAITAYNAMKEAGK